MTCERCEELDREASPAVDGSYPPQCEICIEELYEAAHVNIPADRVWPEAPWN